MMEYGIVWAEDLQSLKEQVQEMINDGWRPQGGIATASRETGFLITFYQAMVRSQ